MSNIKRNSERGKPHSKRVFIKIVKAILLICLVIFVAVGFLVLFSDTTKNNTQETIKEVIEHRAIKKNVKFPFRDIYTSWNKTFLHDTIPAYHSDNRLELNNRPKDIANDIVTRNIKGAPLFILIVLLITTCLLMLTYIIFNEVKSIRLFKPKKQIHKKLDNEIISKISDYIKNQDNNTAILNDLNNLKNIIDENNGFESQLNTWKNFYQDISSKKSFEDILDLKDIKKWPWIKRLMDQKKELDLMEIFKNYRSAKEIKEFPLASEGLKKNIHSIEELTNKLESENKSLKERVERLQPALHCKTIEHLIEFYKTNTPENIELINKLNNLKIKSEVFDQLKKESSISDLRKYSINESINRDIESKLEYEERWKDIDCVQIVEKILSSKLSVEAKQQIENMIKGLKKTNLAKQFLRRINEKKFIINFKQAVDAVPEMQPINNDQLEEVSRHAFILASLFLDFSNTFQEDQFLYLDFMEYNLINTQNPDKAITIEQNTRRKTLPKLKAITDRLNINDDFIQEFRIMGFDLSD